MTDITDYNYESFPLNADRDDFIRFPNVARVSSKAPDGVVTNAADGSKVELGELYRKGITVIEFGSYT